MLNRLLGSLKMFGCLMVILPDVCLHSDLRGLSPIAHVGLMFHQETGFQRTLYRDIETLYEAAPCFMTRNKDRGRSGWKAFSQQNRRHQAVIIHLNFFAPLLAVTLGGWGGWWIPLSSFESSESDRGGINPEIKAASICCGADWDPEFISFVRRVENVLSPFPHLFPAPSTTFHH